MINIADYYRADPNAFQKGFDGVNALRQNVARAGAGNALAGGDYEGAAKALYGAGELEAGSRVQGMGESRQAAARKAKSDQEEDIYKFSGDMASRLSTILDHNKDDPAPALSAFDQYFAPQLARRGEKPDEILQMRTMLEKDPRQAVFTLGAGVASEKGYEIVKGGDGSYVAVDPKSGQPIYQFSAPRTVNVTEGGALYEVPGYSGAPGGAQSPPRIAAQPQARSEPAAQIAGSLDEMQATLSGILPGAKFTSGRRTPEHNRAVGGAANSYHLRGQALDIVPPAGMTTAQAAQAIRASGKYAEVIDEGDHVHVAWGGGGSAPAPLTGGAGQDRVQDDTPRLLISRPKTEKRSRPATAEEKAAYGITAEIPAQMKPDGTLDVISGVGATQKRVPAKIQEGYVGNNSSVRQIDEAIAAIEKNGGALGLKNFLGENVNQRLDPGGVDARASVANIGSLLIHDRSGAAVTAAEAPRLMPFIPQVTDTPEAAIKKLRGLRRQYENANSEIEVAYGEDSGYSPLGSTQGRSAAPPASAVQYLRANPDLRQAFDAKYGQGAAAQALGR